MPHNPNNIPSSNLDKSALAEFVKHYERGYYSFGGSYGEEFDNNFSSKSLKLSNKDKQSPASNWTVVN